MAASLIPAAETAIDRAPMSMVQWRIVAIMVGLNGLDGYDVLSISFAAPGIAAAWNVGIATLGVILSTELVGMAVGSLVMGGLADRSGRRTTILACLAMMAAGMFGASAARSIATLMGWRLMTGVGVGGMLAATNAAVAETANGRLRAFCVILMAAGYPLGTIAGGMFAAPLLHDHGWNVVFLIGGCATLLFIPLVTFFVPETPAFLLHRARPGDLDRANATLTTMGLPPAAQTARPLPAATRPPLAALLAPDRIGTTLILVLAYFAHIITFYFVVKWVPKIVADMGYSASQGAGVLIWASTGGMTGALAVGLLSLRRDIMRLTIAAMTCSAAAVVALGWNLPTLSWLSIAAFAAGATTNAGVVGLYAITARLHPTSLRASATGFVSGMGRGGAALAPTLAGGLFAAGFRLHMVASAMALGSIVTAVALAALSRRTGDRDDPDRI